MNLVTSCQLLPAPDESLDLVPCCRKRNEDLEHVRLCDCENQLSISEA